MLPFMWVEYQNTTAIVAYVLDIQSIVVAAIVAVLQLLSIMAFLAFKLVDSVSSVGIFETPHRSLRNRDVLLNAMVTIVILLFRLVYRRRAVLRKGSSKAGETVQVIIYHCYLELREKESSSPLDRSRTCSLIQVLGNVLAQTSSKLILARRSSTTDTRPASRVSTQDVPTSSFLVLKLVRSRPISFRPPKLLFPSVLPLALYYQLGRLLRITSFHSLAVVSLVSIAACIHHPVHDGDDFHHAPRRSMVLLTLGSTVLCLGPLTRHYSLMLLRRLIYSFDFAFLALQVVAAHLCVCDIFYWHWASCVAVSCSWLWWQWLLTLDALPPISKQYFGINRWTPIPLLLLAGGSQIILVLELVYWDHWSLQNRVFIHLQTARLDTRFYVVPFLLSRLLTALTWTTRLLYRAMNQRSDLELLLLTGNLEHDSVRSISRKRIAPNRGPIPPNVKSKRPVSQKDPVNFQEVS